MIMDKKCFKIWFLLFYMFHILQWNAQSLRAHGDELKKYIEDSRVKPEVICIQETWLTGKNNFRIPGYDVIRRDRIIGGKECPRGGCCIFIRKGMAASVINIEVDHIEAQMILLMYYVSMINNGSQGRL